MIDRVEATAIPRGSATLTMVLALALLGLACTGCLSSAGDAEMDACDADAGKIAFQQCRDCHSLGEESGIRRQGPSLKGVIGRPVGSLATFKYSPAMESADFVWTKENLARFIGNPSEVIPWNGMPFLGVESVAEQESLACFLENAG